jgi:hypothetical protein
MKKEKKGNKPTTTEKKEVIEPLAAKPMAQEIKQTVVINRVSQKDGKTYVHGGIFYGMDNPKLMQSGKYKVSGGINGDVVVLDNGVSFQGTVTDKKINTVKGVIVTFVKL